MRVMLLVTDLKRGGSPRRIARLARGLNAAGVHVCVGCLAPPGPVSAELQRDGIETFACDAAGPNDLLAICRLSRHVRLFRPHVLHATLTHANVAARLVGLWTRTQVVTSTATIEIERDWHRVAETLTARLDRGHIVNSRAVARHVHRAFGVPVSRIHYVPPSVDLGPRPRVRARVRRSLGLAKDDFCVLWVGRLDPVKRLDIVVVCAERMSDVPATFLLAGDGPIRDDVERLARASDARDRIRVLGWRDDVADLMCAADVMLFPSSTEGMPNAVMEAMAIGLPVVAGDVPALRELAGTEPRASATGSPRQARLSLVSDQHPSAYAETLRELLNKPTARKALARRARDWAHHNLDPQATVAAAIRVYRTARER